MIGASRGCGMPAILVVGTIMKVSAAGPDGRPAHFGKNTLSNVEIGRGGKSELHRAVCRITSGRVLQFFASAIDWSARRKVPQKIYRLCRAPICGVPSAG
jgi:hypothetical protein